MTFMPIPYFICHFLFIADSFSLEGLKMLGGEKGENSTWGLSPDLGMISSFDSTKLGKDKITFSFANKTFSYDVSIIKLPKASSEGIEVDENGILTGLKQIVYNLNIPSNVYGISSDFSSSLDSKVRNSIHRIIGGEEVTTFNDNCFSSLINLNEIVLP